MPLPETDLTRPRIVTAGAAIDESGEIAIPNGHSPAGALAITVLFAVSITETVPGLIFVT